MEPAMAIDLDAYLERIGYQGDLRATSAVLHDLHLAHATHIPFENLDIPLGRPIRLDLDSLQAKLVRARRGGYCFEQNLLFAAVLECVGFRVDRLAARVRYRAQSLLPRTHMLLRVEAEGRHWLADVGFGGEGLFFPVPMVTGVECRQFLWAYRLVEEAGYRVLQSRTPEGWQDLHVFTLEPQYPVDYEMASWYVSTHPSSIFQRMFTAQLPTPEARHIVRNYDYLIDRGGVAETRRITEGELLDLLSSRFGLTFPPGTRFPVRAE
jgi:N-hydroxyarylamine O-acetyltransferase